MNRVALLRPVLLADALFDTVFGLLLIIAPWHVPLDLFGLPVSEPEFYMQFTGGLLLACAYLLIQAASDFALEAPIAKALAAVNFAGAIITWSWLLFGDLDISGRGEVTLAVASLILIFFAWVESVRFGQQP